MSLHQVTIDTIVHDAERLFQAAYERALENDNGSAQAIDFLKHPDGSINVNSCLLMLLDPGHLPGCDIAHSSVEQRV